MSDKLYKDWVPSLPSNSTLGGSELFAIVQGGVSVKSSLNSIKSFIGGGISGLTTGYVTKATSSTAIGNSLLFDNGTSVGINTATPDASAAFQVDSTTQGFLMPRVTQTQRDAISAPIRGLLVYNTDNASFDYYDSGWNSLASGTTGDYYDPVIQRTNTIPGSPADGDRYLAGASATTPWVANHIMQWDAGGSAWVDTTSSLVAGMYVYSTTDLKTYKTNGTTWSVAPGIAILQNGNKIGSDLIIGTNDSKHTYFITAGVKRGRFGSGGNFHVALNMYVGDNTLSTTPGARIHAKGASGAVIFRLDSNTTSNIFYVDNDTQAVSSLNGYWIGSNKVLYNSGTENIFVGVGAGNALTTGTNMTALGHQAAYQLTSGGYGVFLGYRAGFSTTDRNYSIYIGREAGYSNNADNSTFIGNYAVHGASVSEEFVAIGSQVAQSVTTAGYGVAIGSHAATGLVDGNYNTFLGRYTTTTKSDVNSSIAIGTLATVTADNQWVVGYYQAPISQAYFGRGVAVDSNTSLGSFSMSVAGINAGNADTSSSNSIFYWDGSIGTGTGVGGPLVIRVAPAGSTGSTRNSLVELMRFKGAGIINISNYPTSNSGLSTGDWYVGTAADALSNSDKLIIVKQ